MHSKVGSNMRHETLTLRRCSTFTETVAPAKKIARTTTPRESRPRYPVSLSSRYCTTTHPSTYFIPLPEVCRGCAATACTAGARRPAPRQQSTGRDGRRGRTGAFACVSYIGEGKTVGTCTTRRTARPQNRLNPAASSAGACRLRHELLWKRRSHTSIAPPEARSAAEASTASQSCFRPGENLES